MLGTAMVGLAAYVALDVVRRPSLDERLGEIVTAHGLAPLDAGAEQPEALLALGEALFFDRELSGNRDIACATCHHPSLASGDGLPVSIGTGGTGLGPDRVLGEGRPLIPRNAPDVWNRGAEEWMTMFWDGRVAGSAAHGFTSPAREALPDGLPNVLAVQAMFPVTSDAEMRGFPGDVDVTGAPNELAVLAPDDFTGIWAALMDRLLAIPEYVDLFEAAFPDVAIEELGFEHAATAIGAFEAHLFAADATPWDAYLGGDLGALTDEAKRGAVLFFGDAGCAACHSGTLLTDQQHHNVASPQVGPGKGAESPDDMGRARETGSTADMYAFRTPPLRNVVVNGPWFHDGAYTTLEAAVRHMIEPEAALAEYDPSQLPESMRIVYDAPERIATVLDYLDARLTPRPLDDDESADLVAFLEALTDPRVDEIADRVPDQVPSGLPVDR